MEKILTIAAGFLLGIATIWMKEVITQHIDLRRKRRALRSICISEVNVFQRVMSRLDSSIQSPLYVYAIPTTSMELVRALLLADTQHAHFYSTFLVNLEVAHLLQRDLHAILSSNPAGAASLRDQLRRQLTFVAEAQLHYAMHGPTLSAGMLADEATEYVNQQVHLVRSRANNLPTVESGA